MPLTKISTHGINDGTIVNADINASAAIASTKLSGVGITLGTAVASTSGTSITFTDIPSSVKQVIISFSGVSTNGSSNFLIQIGSGSVTTSGYISTGGTNGGSTFTSTAGCVIAVTDSGSTAFGQVVITLLNTNVYVISSVSAQSGTNRNSMGQGGVTIGGALDRVRFTTVNGTDTFDAGSINIMYQ
jgi:hypothetical protein